MDMLNNDMIYTLLTFLDTVSFTRFIKCNQLIYSLCHGLVPVKRSQSLVEIEEKPSDTVTLKGYRLLNGNLEGKYTVTYQDYTSVIREQTDYYQFLNPSHAIETGVYEDGKDVGTKVYKIYANDVYILYAEIDYEDDMKIRKKIYYPNGNLDTEMHYISGYIETFGAFYNEDGSLIRQDHYVNE
jgi:antitoxin component YwqK of YwqJK toxin-antitoxin module